LPAGRTTLAVRHRTVEEIWFFLGGTGEVWRRDASGEEVVGVGPNTSLTIPLGVEFQFRAIGAKALTFIIATTPPWPGAEEAMRVADHWPPDVG
jgi:mannose-6-phosphate isomerase-like protein (cupin superfamily)